MWVFLQDEDGHIVFTFDLNFGDSTQQSGVITRLNDMELKATCSYPKNYPLAWNFEGGIRYNENIILWYYMKYEVLLIYL